MIEHYAYLLPIKLKTSCRRTISKIIDAHQIRTCKVHDNSILPGNPHMPNVARQPRNYRRGVQTVQQGNLAFFGSTSPRGHNSCISSFELNTSSSGVASSSIEGDSFSYSNALCDVKYNLLLLNSMSWSFSLED